MDYNYMLLPCDCEKHCIRSVMGTIHNMLAFGRSVSVHLSNATHTVCT